MSMQEKFTKDFNNRFARKAMVSDDSLGRICGEQSQHVCSRGQIKEWINNWAVINTTREDKFMQNVDIFIDAKFDEVKEIT